MLLNGGYFKGSGGGIDSSPVVGRVSAVCAVGGVCGLEQASKAPSRIKVTEFRIRFLTTSCTDLRNTALRNTDLRNIARTIVGMTIVSAQYYRRMACLRWSTVSSASCVSFGRW